MNIYHYSKNFLPILLTKRKQGYLTDKEIRDADENARRFKEEGSYIDHISFFFDPIPSKLLGEIFGPPHEVWVKGTELFEFVVDADTLDKDILYRVVESFKKTELLDKFSEEHNWVEDNKNTLKIWIELYNKKSKEWKELGTSKKDLLDQIKLNKGKTELGYKRAFNRPDFEDGKMLYAANVPHLMVYPKTGEIRFESVNKLVIGGDKREPLYPNKKIVTSSLSLFN